MFTLLCWAMNNGNQRWELGQSSVVAGMARAVFSWATMEERNRDRNEAKKEQK